jgi:hypothetical protein
MPLDATLFRCNNPRSLEARRIGAHSGRPEFPVFRGIPRARSILAPGLL